MIRLILCFTLIPFIAFAEPEDDPTVDRFLAQAFEEIIFGPEFTFWVPELDANGQPKADGSGEENPFDEVQIYVNHLKKHLIRNQKPEHKFEKDIFFDKVDEIAYAEFTSQFGWDFNVAADPGVIEVTMNPMTVEQYQANSNSIQDAIFDSASAVGYNPSLFGGGGHINISLGYLKKRPLLFRNFIVDLLNHNELFLGVLGFDTNNALSPAMYSQGSWDAIKHELNFMDAYGYDLDSLEQFAIQLNRIFSDSRDPYLKYWHPYTVRRGKHSAFQFKFHLNEKSLPESLGKRMELRAVRPQASIDVWIRQIRLLEKRIKYLETLEEPIQLKPLLSVKRISQLPANEEEATTAVLTPPVDAQKAIQAFHQYVTESGEKWEDHQDYLWPKWHTDGEVIKFNNNICNTLLGDAL